MRTPYPTTYSVSDHEAPTVAPGAPYGYSAPVEPVDYAEPIPVVDTRAAARFAAAIQAKFDEFYSTQDYNPEHVYTVDFGPKYDRIVDTDKYGSRSVHAFVGLVDGHECLIKSAGWKSPAKTKNGLAARYVLDTPEGFAAAVEAADPFGYYLYANRGVGPLAAYLLGKKG